MAKINLLPWRETRSRERRQHYFITMGAVALITVVFGIGIHVQIKEEADFQNQRNNYLLQKITLLDAKIASIKSLELEKTRLLNRMKVIQQLQRSRPEIVHLFEEIALTLPDGAQIQEISQEGNEIKIDGFADSNSRISAFMRNIEKSKWLKEPELIIIDANKVAFPDSSWFSLKVQRSQP